tara:strand:- start:558 stop:1373 length:816 start_codon:yes stop_codon:yes gene_type:complete
MVSTPIGNLEDITFRAINILKSADFIICENPKHSLRLLNKFGIKKKLYSLHDHNEKLLIKKIEKFQNDSIIALISDAGSPLISDPGFKLVQHFIDNGLFITSIPGPTSLIPALQLSGLPIDNFAYFGFSPKNAKSIGLLLNKIINTGLTSLIFISGNKIIKFLEILVEKDDQIKVALCKELTKINETITRFSAKNLMLSIQNNEINLKGEFILIMSSAKNKEKLTLDDVIKKQILHLLKKYSLTEVVEIVHKISGISKKNIYQVALMIKNG